MSRGTVLTQVCDFEMDVEQPAGGRQVHARADASRGKDRKQVIMILEEQDDMVVELQLGR
jgi:hypothetical protein